MKRFTIQIFTLLLLITLAVPAFAGRVLAEIEYFYADDGTLIGKAFNGKRVNFEYDLRGQLRAVKDAQGKDLERYTYDPAGNRLSKTINGVTTAYTYDKANQLVTSTVNGVTTHYKYDAAGRMIQAGDKKYIYNGNNKVVAIWQNGDIIAKFEYNIDGQISKAIYGDKVEEFMWDGLALIWRSGVTYINEPYVTGGNPVMAGDDVLFNDMLGSTLAVNGKAVEMSSFGETADKNAFFTGKPMIDELGYSFLFRDYNPHQGKWTTSDPLGYPDGWNNLAYCNNGAVGAIDWLGGYEIEWEGNWTDAEKARVLNAITGIENRIVEIRLQISKQIEHLLSIMYNSNVYTDKANALIEKSINLRSNLGKTLGNIASETYNLEIYKINFDGNTCAQYWPSPVPWFDDELRLDTGWFNGDIDYRTLFHELMHTWSDDGQSNDNFKDSDMLESLYYTDFSKWIWYKDEYRKIFE